MGNKFFAVHFPAFFSIRVAILLIVYFFSFPHFPVQLFCSDFTRRLFSSIFHHSVTSCATDESSAGLMNLNIVQFYEGFQYRCKSAVHLTCCSFSVICSDGQIPITS